VENPSNVFTGSVGLADSINPGLHRREQWHRARAAHVCLLRLGMPRVNVLLIGIDGMVWNVLETLPLHLPEPITTWSPSEPFALPPPARSGTVILHDIGEMTHDDQMRTLEWLEQTGRRTQVVSTTPVSLLSRVQDGTFIDTLYYRLNTLCVNVNS
jgi:hypothetical protein